METPDASTQEQQRVAALRSFDILDTPPEKEFDDLVRLAAFICGTPIALISLVDDQRQWFKAKLGLAIEQTPKDISFCKHAIDGTRLFVVPDASQDSRFKDNPLVASEPNIRFYAGAPLIAKSGHALGTLCVIDYVPRTLDATRLDALQTLGVIVVNQLELRQATSRIQHDMAARVLDQAKLREAHGLLEIRIQERTRELEDVSERLTLALEASGLSVWDLDVASGQIFQTGGWSEILGGERMPGFSTLDDLVKLVHPDDVEALANAFVATLRGQHSGYVIEHRVRTRTGEWKWIASRGKVVARDANGWALRAVGTNRDITERKRADMQLETSEARFRALTEISADWYWEQDENYRVTMISKGDQGPNQTLSALGTTRWDTPALNLSEADWERHRAVLDHRLPFTDFVIQRKDAVGEVRSHSVSGVPIFDAKGVFKGYRGVGRDITLQENSLRQITYLAHFDSLTNLPNRALVMDRIEQAIHAARRYNHQLAVLFLDIDNFKRINDSYGHAAGDEVLKEVSRRTSQVLREVDSVGRLGGDEFLVILPHIQDNTDGAQVSRKVLQALESPVLCDGKQLQVTLSIGIAIFPQDGETGNTLMRNADMAMYRAKQSGKAVFRFYEPLMGSVAAELLELENDLRLAVQRHEFELHYQPQFTLASHTVCGVEALIRWHHPTRGLVMPDLFIKVLEDSNLIHPVGEWVLDQACRQMRQWQLAGLPDLRMAVNASVKQLKTPSFLPTVEAVLARAGLAPHSLELEMTESMGIDYAEEADRLIRACQKIGVKLCLDDFGTGYSSLSYLKRFPVDVVKIDQSFVQDVDSNTSSHALIAGIIAMSKGLNLTVVAEGVETEAQMQLLAKMGCEIGQGHYFSKPLAAEECFAFLKLHVGKAQA